jgi:hypothetical protein
VRQGRPVTPASSFYQVEDLNHRSRGQRPRTKRPRFFRLQGHSISTLSIARHSHISNSLQPFRFFSLELGVNLYSFPALRRFWFTPLLVLLLAFPFLTRAQFDYTTCDGTITITGYSDKEHALVIPSSIDGLPVTTIGDSAFLNHRSLTNIALPEGLITIECKAFKDCTGLTALRIPDCVTSIGTSAFGGCTNLARIQLGNSLTNVGNSAFWNTSLTNVAIPCGVLNIGVQAFFHCVDLVGVTIPNSVVTIGEAAFLECRSLRSVAIPGRISAIGASTFAYCMSLTNVTLCNGITEICPHAFMSCKSLTSIVVPDTVTNIGAFAFDNCIGLATITIGSSVTHVAGGAFDSCKNLRDLFFLGNAPADDSAGSSVFEQVENATVYYLPGTCGWGPTFSGRPTALRPLPNR